MCAVAKSRQTTYPSGSSSRPDVKPVTFRAAHGIGEPSKAKAMRYLNPIICALVLWTTAAAAQTCRLAMTGAACVTAGPPLPERESAILRLKANQPRGATLTPGTVLPRNQYNILLLADYYGLPAVKDGWVYMEVDRQVYRVDFRTYRVLEMVTDQTAANW